jgi:hypothetical protein
LNNKSTELYVNRRITRGYCETCRLERAWRGSHRECHPNTYNIYNKKNKKEEEEEEEDKKEERKKGRKNHTCVGEKERRSSTMRKAGGKRKINSGRVGVRRKKREENEYFSEVS